MVVEHVPEGSADRHPEVLALQDFDLDFAHFALAFLYHSISTTSVTMAMLPLRPGRSG